MRDLPNEPYARIIVAADVDGLAGLNFLLNDLEHRVGLVKLGLKLQTSVGGPRAIETAYLAGYRVMYDGKFHDIPNTMAKATRALAGQDVNLFTVHASASIDGMKAAAKEKGSSKMLAVTVLTSIDDETCRSIYCVDVLTEVLRLARDARVSGADGLVCSPKEITMIRDRHEFDDLILVTPGVRPSWSAKGDQARVMTPREAMAAGADYLVIGRPITQPPKEIGSPIKAAELIAKEIAAGLAARGGGR